MDFWKSLDEAEVKTESKSFEAIVDGTYSAVVSDVEIKEDMFQASFSVEFTIDDGEFKNRKVWYSAVLNADTPPERLAWAKTAICKLAGVNTTGGKPTEVLSGCKGNRAEIYIKRNQSKKDPTKFFTNVFVNKKLEEAVPF